MIRLFALFLLIFLGGCSAALETFDAVVAKDRGARLVAKGQAFGAGPRRKLDVYAPSGAVAGAKLPIIVFFYGGSWNSGTKDGYGFAGQALASRGFVTAVPDYRLVPEVRFPAFLEDSAEAVRWVRANAARFGGDPDRIILAGHSAGAYNATMLSVDPRWLGADRAAVKGLIALSGPFSFLPLDRKVTADAFGTASDLAQTQPINFVTKDDPPALILIGGRDDIVFPRIGVGMAAEYRLAGVPVEAKIYDKLGHVGLVTALTTWFRGRAPVLDDMTAFARKVTAAD